jgi:predicted permease
MSWYHRFVNLFRSRRLTNEIDREMAFHHAELVDELVARGMSEGEARREARRRFGNREVLRERVHDADVLVWVESLWTDLRYAARALRATPAFTAVAVLSLGLGIGVNTAIFSLINAVMLRSLPVHRPEELVQLTMGDNGDSFTNPQWERIRDDDVLAGSLAFSDQSFNLTSGGVVRRAGGALVSGEYFQVLGVQPVLGRVLSAGDDVRGCAGAAVLGHGFWQREYGGDPEVVGRTISINSHTYPIVGVVAAGFQGLHVGRSAGIFMPLCTIDMWRGGTLLDARSTWFLSVLGRRRPGSTLAETEVTLAASSLGVFESTVPGHWTPEEQEEYAAMTLGAIPAARGMSYVRGQYREALFTLLVVVGVVLLIACANVAQLLLARATARQHEIAVRLALGSGRVRLVRQLLTESVTLSLLGALVGILFARWSSQLLVGFLAQGGSTVWLDLSLDLRVLGFAIAVATVTGILFGLAPAWRSARVDPQTAMRGAGRSILGASQQRFAKGIVAAQVALSFVLVVAAGLLVGSFRRLAAIDPGFRSEGVLVVSTNWSALGLSGDRNHSFLREQLDRVREIPGIRRAGASLLTPISGTSWNDNIVVDGFSSGDGSLPLAWFNAVTDGYMETLGTSLLAGRDLSPQDRAVAPRVALVNQTFARRYFGDASPLGKQIRVSDHDSLGPPMEIVGVVEDAKYRRLDEETLETAYVPLDQANLWAPGIEISMRAYGPPAALVSMVTEAIRDVNPGIALEFTTLRDQVATSLARPRLLATLSGFFGALALLLAVVGLYGTMSYSVERRRNEIGIRIALGISRPGVLRLVAVEALKVVAIGVVVGGALAFAATRLVATFLYGLTPTDPATLVFSAVLLAGVAVGAGLVPAWRAAGVDPMEALRQE